MPTLPMLTIWAFHKILVPLVWSVSYTTYTIISYDVLFTLIIPCSLDICQHLFTVLCKQINHEKHNELIHIYGTWYFSETINTHIVSLRQMTQNNEKMKRNKILSYIKCVWKSNQWIACINCLTVQSAHAMHEISHTLWLNNPHVSEKNIKQLH